MCQIEPAQATPDRDTVRLDTLLLAQLDHQLIKVRIPGDLATGSARIWPRIPKDVATFDVPLLSGGLLVSVGRSFVNGFRLGFSH